MTLAFNIKNTALLVFSALLVISGALAVFAPANVQAAPAACYIRPSSAGGELTPTNCPDSYNTPANQNRCFSASMNNPTRFTSITCPSDYARLACEASGGQWQTRYEGSVQVTSCTNCPNGMTSNGSVCETPAADPGPNGTPGDGTDLEPTYNPDGDCVGTSINQNNCGIVKYLVIFINALSAMVGLVVVGSIIYGGIQYSSSSGDPSKASAAKDRIRNAIIALLFFLFGYALLNWLVPGGVL